LSKAALEKELSKLEGEILRSFGDRPLIPENPIKFCAEWLGFTPTKYQTELIKFFVENQFVAARWCRQSGKSHIIAVLLLHYALTHPDIYIAVVGPSWRQTKLIIRKINAFLRKIPPTFYHKSQRTIVCLTNGSIIEAFPNNPDTIRGPTLHVVYCDEMNFIANDEEMYDAILFTLGTTNGKFICSSTPWNTDSIFYKIFNSEDYGDFKRSHVTWKEAQEPNGPLKRDILRKIQRQLRGDPWRWKREMEAEWAEDENIWLPQSLISKCIDQALDYYPFESQLKGLYLYVGLDLGKYRDYSVLSVVMREDQIMKLIHLYRFPLRTPYASVIGYVKTLSDRWHTMNQIYVDVTGVGEYIVEDMKNAGIHGVEGIKFTAPKKEELATNLKQRMLDEFFKIPYVPPRNLKDIDLTAELNVERFQLRKTGGVDFNHPEGTHDDVFWSIALALAASRTEAPAKLVRAF